MLELAQTRPGLFRRHHLPFNFERASVALILAHQRRHPGVFAQGLPGASCDCAPLLGERP